MCEAVNTAFADNPAAGCAVGVQDGILSVVIRQQDLDSLPDQTPGMTSAGRPTLKKLTQRDRMLWWLTTLGSNIIATLKEAFATAPAITAIDLAALTRIPDTQRLGIIAYGRWTRQAVESTPWRQPQDALHFLDIGQEVACSITTTASGNLSTKVKPLDTDKVAGLRTLLASLQDDAEPATASLARIETGMANAPVPPQPPAADHYQLTPFAQVEATDGTITAPDAAPDAGRTDPPAASPATAAFSNAPVRVAAARAASADGAGAGADGGAARDRSPRAPDHLRLHRSGRRPDPTAHRRERPRRQRRGLRVLQPAHSRGRSRPPARQRRHRPTGR
ncbi:hypothetical protein GCM10023088_51620 [Actinomadura verrucosospora]